MKITAKQKPKWNDLRWRLSNVLIYLARLVYPRNPEVEALMLEIMTDQIIYGQSFFRVIPTEIYRTPNNYNEDGGLK